MELTLKEELEAIKILKLFCIRFQNYELAAMARDAEKTVISKLEEDEIIEENLRKRDLATKKYDIEYEKLKSVDYILDNYKLSGAQLIYIESIVRKYSRSESSEKLLANIKEIMIPIIRNSQINKLLDNDDGV